MLHQPYLPGSDSFAKGFLTAGALIEVLGGCSTAAADLIFSFLSSLSFSNFICCCSATFFRSISEPPALVVFLADLFPPTLSAELEKKDWVFSGCPLKPGHSVYLITSFIMYHSIMFQNEQLFYLQQAAMNCKT